MKSAVIVSYTKGVVESVGSVVLEGSIAVIRARNRALEESLAMGIYHPGLMRDVLPEEGVKFMEALPYRSSSYLRYVME